MALASWRTTITDQSGNVVPNASIEVREEIGGAPLASLFSDRLGASPLGNPTDADPNGFISLHVAGGAYQITATSGAFTRQWRYVAIGTAAERDAEDLLAEIPSAGDGLVADSNTAGEVTFHIDKATIAEVQNAAADKVLTADLIESASAGEALTDAATVAVDWDAAINFTLTVTANRVIGNPTNGQPGTWRTIMVQGNNGTDRTVTFGNQYLGEVPVITDCDSARWYHLMVYCHTISHFTVSAKVART